MLLVLVMEFRSELSDVEAPVSPGDRRTPLGQRRDIRGEAGAGWPRVWGGGADDQATATVMSDRQRVRKLAQEIAVAVAPERNEPPVSRVRLDEFAGIERAERSVGRDQRSACRRIGPELLTG